MYLYFCGFIITSIFINFVKSFVEKDELRQDPLKVVNFDLGDEQGARVARRQFNGRHSTGSRQRGWAPTQWLEAGDTADNY